MDSLTKSNVGDSQTPKQSFLNEVLSGLGDHPRRLPCKYLYDHRGSALFDRICELEEYYLTRSELAIMRRYAGEMGRQIGPGAMLVEYGSGSSSKTRLLLDHLPDPVAYVPVDISKKHLLRVCTQLQQDYSHIEVLPVAADFTTDFQLPEPNRDYTHAAVYFPGSTIGNFQHHEAIELLKSISKLCGRGGGLLIGIDLDKDPATLELAYDDPAGITAEFSLNLLHRMREELGARIEIDQFEHVAAYNPDHTRIEIFLRSLRDQVIVIDQKSFEVSAGELIHTEYSHKYTIEDFAEIASHAGLTLRKSWTDEQESFAVLHFAVLDGANVE